MSEEHKHHEHAEHKVSRIPVMLLGLAVALIFGVAIFSYQVNETERAVVLTFGSIEGIRGPGLHFKWPMPVQKVIKYDVRLRCYDGNIGKLEETTTADGKNITVSIYTVYQISDLRKFQSAGGNILAAEEFLGSLMRTAKGAVVGRYRFDELVNSDPKKIMISKMEKEMLQEIAPRAMEQYGLRVVSANLKMIGVPDKPAKAIADRMVSERKAAAAVYKEEGNVLSKKIMTNADEEKRKAITNAEAEAKKLRAEGDSAAAAHYKVFSEKPELAVFLRKLESMKKLLGKRTTLVLDTNSAPFDILKTGSTQLEKTPAGKASK